MRITNNKAKYDYSIESTIIAGVVLVGAEIKSLVKNEADLSGSYVLVRDSGVVLIGAYIKPVSVNKFGVEYEPNRDRQLLLNKNEIKWLKQESQKGWQLIPLRFFTAQNGRVKLEIGIGRRKKVWDKRGNEKLKEFKRNSY